MTEDEFREIRRLIAAAFPALRAYVRGLHEDQKSALQRAWQACLIRQAKADVEAAIDQLAKSAADPWKFNADKDRAGQTISRLAAEIAVKKRSSAWEAIKNGEDGPRYDCHLCRDTGYVQCMKSTFIAIAYREKRITTVGPTYATFCSCQKGRDRADRDLSMGLKCVDYDPCRDVWVDQPADGILSTIRAL